MGASTTKWLQGMETRSHSLNRQDGMGCESEAGKPAAPALPQSAVDQIRQHLHIPATVLATVILLALLAQGLVLLPSLGSPMHVWTDFTLLVLTVFLVIAAGLLWLNGQHLTRHHQDLETACLALERAMTRRSRLLAESNSMWLALFNAFQERVVIVDADDRIVQANRFATAQIGHDASGRIFSDVFPPCELPAERRCELRLIQHTFAEGVPQRGRLIRGGVQCQSLLAIDTYPVCSADGVTEMVIEIARDVTKRIENDMRHQHQEKMAALGMLAAGFAHDLGNPLASLSSELQLMRRETDSDRIRESLLVLDKHVDRISRILRDVLNFARRRTGRVENIALAQAVHDALRLLEHDPRAKNISIHVDLTDTLPSVLISEDDILLLLLNLIVNAFDAMPKGGKLSVEGKRTASGSVQLTLSDTGIGMNDALVRDATQTLYTTKEEHGGTGLGLPLCVDIMRAAGGRLDIQSKPGQGTRITLEFPPTAGSNKEDQVNGGEHSDR